MILIWFSYFELILSPFYKHKVSLLKCFVNFDGQNQSWQLRSDLTSTEKKPVTSCWPCIWDIITLPGVLQLCWQLTYIQYALSSLFTWTANNTGLFPICRIDFSIPKSGIFCTAKLYLYDSALSSSLSRYFCRNCSISPFHYSLILFPIWIE